MGYVNTRPIAMSTKRKRSVLLTKEMQTIISPLEKGEKGTTNLALEFKISKQQISGIRKNKGKVLKFTDSIEMSEGLKRNARAILTTSTLSK